MRILTVRQPYVWAIMHGGKKIENRVRNIAGSYRGKVAIHAGMSVAPEDADVWNDPKYIVAMAQSSASVRHRLDLRGVIVGVVDLVGTHKAAGSNPGGLNLCSPTGLCSKWAEPDVWHLELENPRPLATPIPYKGALGLRTLDPETTRQIELALAEGGK